MDMKQVDVLGTPYRIFFQSVEENEKLKDLNGYCDYSSKEIFVNSCRQVDDDIKDYDWAIRKTVRHELVHAFLSESGLLNCSYHPNTGWAYSEEMVDWIAL